MNRREWLQRVGAGAAIAAIGCGDSAQGGSAHAAVVNAARTSAAIVLEPTADALLVAVWSVIARSAIVELRAGGVLLRSTVVALGASGSGAVDLAGLAAARRYEVIVRLPDGTRLGPHVARTAPHDDDARAVRLAVAADCDPAPEFDSALFEQLAGADADVYVTIGDFPYTDDGPPAHTVAEYRARHAELRAAPRIRTWLETGAVRAIYDDHEFRNDWHAGWVAAEPARYAAAMQVWDEFFPLRATVGDVRYRRWRWGAHVECFQLDCRRFRSANAAPDDARKTMLGAAQKRWLLAGLAASRAAFKLVFTSVPLAFGTGDDHWTTFSTERDEIFAALAAARVPGVLFVSGDQHFFAAHRHAHGLREFQIGPLARGLGTPGPTADGVLFRHVAANVGVIDVDADGRQLTFAGVGADGARFYSETFTADQLAPRA